MPVFEDIDCPTCDGKIRVIVEDNKVTSPGVCTECDQTFSAERLQFNEACKKMENEFCDDILFRELDYELGEFYALLD